MHKLGGFPHECAACNKKIYDSYLETNNSVLDPITYRSRCLTSKLLRRNKPKIFAQSPTCLVRTWEGPWIDSMLVILRNLSFRYKRQ